MIDLGSGEIKGVPVRGKFQQMAYKLDSSERVSRWNAIVL